MPFDDGRNLPWIDENLNPLTGEWLTRTLKKHGVDNGPAQWVDGQANPHLGQERGKDYNHSTFCDLVINGLMGLRPCCEERLKIHPLVPNDWDYFCLERVPYHEHEWSMSFDRDGSRYGRDPGRDY